MVRRIFKQKTVFSIILISTFALSIISTYAPVVLGTWTSNGSTTEENGLLSPTYATDQYYNQSVAVSPDNQSIHVVFLSDGGDDYIYYHSSNTWDLEKELVPADLEQLNNISGNEEQTAVTHPDIAVDYNGIAHVVYEGVHDSNSYIYYTNNSKGSFTNYTAISGAGGTNPSIVCTSDNAIHVFFENGANVDGLTSSNNGLSFANSGAIAAGGNNPDAVVSSNAIYVVSRDSSGSMMLSNATSSGGWDSYVTVPYGGAVGNDPKIDAAGDFIAVTYWNSSGIQMFNSTGMYKFGIPTEVAAASISNNDPSIAMDRHGGVSVFYSRNIETYKTHTHQGIFVRSTRDNPAFNIEDHVATDHSALGFATYKRYPAVARYNDTTVVVYQREDWVADELQSWKLFITGFLNSYVDSPAAYSQIRIGEDPQGVYLFEGLTVSYNSTIDYLVNITITDNATGISWTNITTLPKGGGYERKIAFYDPINMFLSNGFYWISIRNASSDSGSKLAKFWVDFTRNTNYEEGDPLQYFITEETGPDGILSKFKIGIEWRYYNDRPILEKGRDNQQNGEFSTTNYADLYQIELDNDRIYNLTVTDGTPYDKVEVRLYNETARLANVSSALFTFDTSDGVKTSKAFQVNESNGFYYIMLFRGNRSVEPLGYNIYCETAPRVPSLTLGKTFFNVSTVELTWEPDPFNIGYVHHYNIQIDNVSTFDSPYLQSNVNIGETNKNLTFHGFIVQSDEYYWRVSVTNIYDNTGLWSVPVLNSKTGNGRFVIDTSPPSAPSAIPLALFQTTGSFRINWTDSLDEPLGTVEYYNVYMSTKHDVEITSENLVTTPGTLHPEDQYFTNSLSPGYYYFKITATDFAGWESPASEEINTVVVFGAYFNSTQQNFNVQAGDTLEYEILNVISPTSTGTGIPYFTFGYGTWATEFQTGDRFHFWVKQVDRLSVTPVRGDFYAKKTSSQSYNLLTTEYSVVPFVASSNMNFMYDVADAYVAALMSSDEGRTKSVTQTNYTGTFQYGLAVLDTFCITYSGVIAIGEDEDEMDYAVEATFAYDLSTGVLVELTTYSELTEIGYTLKLVSGTPSFVASWKSWAPVIFLGSVFILAGIINIIVKRVEYR